MLLGGGEGSPSRPPGSIVHEVSSVQPSLGINLNCINELCGDELLNAELCGLSGSFSDDAGSQANSLL